MLLSSSGLISVLGFCLALRCGHPSQVKQKTMVLPTANWAPPETGRAFAFASMDVVRVQFGCNVCVMTRVPAQAQAGCAAGISSIATTNSDGLWGGCGSASVGKGRLGKSRCRIVVKILLG